jgi:hypothetical protein
MPYHLISETGGKDGNLERNIILHSFYHGFLAINLKIGNIDYVDWEFILPASLWFIHYFQMKSDFVVVLLVGAIGFFVIMLQIYQNFFFSCIVFTISGGVGILLGNSYGRKK